MTQVGEIPTGNIAIFNPSDYRPEYKDSKEYRNYVDSKLHDRVQRTYMLMHTHQCVEFVEQRIAKWCKFNHVKMGLMEACKMLDRLVDESDPDVDLPNSVHAFQTAERIRDKHPDKEWFILTGFIHDLGKVMALYGEHQWATVGDTFPVGCEFSDACVFGQKSFALNQDIGHSVYSAKNGRYDEHCGFDQVTMSWGHDEYLYRVLQNHGHKLPEQALYIIRYHSFYPWHTGGAYTHLENEKDREMLAWIREFNQFDLYSKSEVVPDIEALTPYYQGLIDKFVPGELSW